MSQACRCEPRGLSPRPWIEHVERRRGKPAGSLSVRLLCLALVSALAPSLFADEKTPAKAERQTIAGKVTPLSAWLQKRDVRLDPDAAATLYALVTDEGKIYPLVKDDGSRMFFLDSRLLNRPMRLTGRVLPNSQLFQVLEVQSVIKGKPHEVYYWCDVCTIKRFEKKICECCGGPMELRETPAKD